MINLFGIIPKTKLFSRRSDKILQRKQAEFANYDELFIKWATFKPYENIRYIINDSYERISNYLDKNFINRFGIKGEFHGRLWELFIGIVLKEKGFNLVPKRENGTPDFCIEYNGKRIWIECVYINNNHTTGNINNGLYQLDTISEPRYIRLTQAFTEKSKKYLKTYKNNGVKDNDVFIIAINGELMSFTDKGMLGPLYNVGLTQVDIKGNVSYQELNPLMNHNGSPIPKGLFLNGENNHISGVIFLDSCYMFFNDEIKVERESLHFIPNINAVNKIMPDFEKKLDMHIPIIFN